MPNCKTLNQLTALMEAFRHVSALIRADLPSQYKEMVQHDGGSKEKSDESSGPIYCNRDKSGRNLEIVEIKTEEVRKRSSHSNPLCFRCGKPEHLAYYCRNSIVCFVCGKQGHWARECSSPQEEELGTENTNGQLEIGQTTTGMEIGELEIEEAECVEIVNQDNAFIEVAEKIDMSDLDIQRLSKEFSETKLELRVCREEYKHLKRSFENMISGLKMEKDDLVANMAALEAKINNDLMCQLVTITKERDDLMLSLVFWLRLKYENSYKVSHGTSQAQSKFNSNMNNSYVTNYTRANHTGARN